MGKSTLSSFDSKAWKRSRPLVTVIQGFIEMSGVQLSLCHCTALQSRTGPEQGFPCVLILTGKNLFYLLQMQLL